MEEARAVIQRLARIEALEHEGAPPRTVLAEVRQLLREGEAWLEAEHEGTDVASEALEGCRLAYEAGVTPVA